MQGSRILMAEPHDASLLWQVGSEIRLVGSHLQHAVHILCSHADCRHIAKAWLPMVSPALLYICRLHIFFIWSNGHIYICTSNEPEVVDLVKNLICGDESRQAARTLYADLISWQHRMCPLLVSPALQYMKALCFLREPEQMSCDWRI
jgi:hypothetical protein